MSSPAFPTSAPLPGTDPVAVVVGVREWVGQVDPAVLSRVELVDLLTELEALKGAVAASQARVVAEFEVTERMTHLARGGRVETASRSVGAQVGFALRRSPSRGDAFRRFSLALVDQMPHAHRALAQGRLCEWAANVLVTATAGLPVGMREAVDERLADRYGALSPARLGDAARGVVAELDAAAVVAKHSRAVKSRRVSTRPAPDGMAYLTVLGPMIEIIGAYATLHRDAKTVIATGEAHGRGVGAVAADLALERLSGRATGQGQPVAVHLVMTDRSLTGVGDPDRPVHEAASVPGHGHLPAASACAHLTDPAVAATLRRLFTHPNSGDLVAMDSRARRFTGGLRRMIDLRDQWCATPFCDAPIRDADHATAHRNGGPTSYTNGNGTCRRCDLGKEDPGWRVTILGDGIHHRVTAVTTPTGHTHHATPPALLGPAGRRPPPTPVFDDDPPWPQLPPDPIFDDPDVLADYLTWHATHPELNREPDLDTLDPWAFSPPDPCPQLAHL